MRAIFSYFHNILKIINKMRISFIQQDENQAASHQGHHVWNLSWASPDIPPQSQEHTWCPNRSLLSLVKITFCLIRHHMCLSGQPEVSQEHLWLWEVLRENWTLEDQPSKGKRKPESPTAGRHSPQFCLPHMSQPKNVELGTKKTKVL